MPFLNERLEAVYPSTEETLALIVEVQARINAKVEQRLAALAEEERERRSRRPRRRRAS